MNPARVEMDRRSPMGVRISGVGAEIPPRVVSTAELEEQADIGRFGFEPGWLERVTAVRERRWAEPDAILGTQPTLGRHPRRAAAVHRRQLKPRGLCVQHHLYPFEAFDRGGERCPLLGAAAPLSRALRSRPRQTDARSSPRERSKLFAPDRAHDRPMTGSRRLDPPVAERPSHVPQLPRP
jgi:hypothetical protein